MGNVEEIYKRGYTHGFKDALKDHESEKSYEQGLSDAWECANKIMSMSCGELSEIFPDFKGFPFEECSASEAIAKIKEYEEKKKFHVGDEIKTVWGNMCIDDIGVIIRIDDDGDCLHILSGRDDEDYTNLIIHPNREGVHVEKTGRHFPQIEEVLNAMKENINDI